MTNSFPTRRSSYRTYRAQRGLRRRLRNTQRPAPTAVALGEDERRSAVADLVLMERQDLERDSRVVQHRRHGRDRAGRGGGRFLDTLPQTESRFEGPKRSEEHTSELQSLMRRSYAVLCLKKKKNNEETTP